MLEIPAQLLDQTPNKAIPHLVGLKQGKTDHLVLFLVLLRPFPPIIAATASPEMELKPGGITPKARKMVSVLGRGEGEGGQGVATRPLVPAIAQRDWPVPGQVLGPDPKHMEVI